jgi:hypothetical protein
MQLTLEPLLVMEVMSLFFLVTGNPAEDLRPVNGVAKLACTGARLTVVTAAEEIKAIFLLFLLSSPSTSSFCFCLWFNSNLLYIMVKF